MGKRKDTTGKVAPKAQKSMTIWEDLYTDLTPNVAEALRLARVKPDQLLNMTDGDITAIQGIFENGLEEIRSKYSPDLSIALTEESAVGAGSSSPETLAPDEAAGPRPANKRHDFKNGKAIRASKSKVDSQKKYTIEEAVKLVKVTNITKFVATVASLEPHRQRRSNSR
jgi:hypothetical protein